MTNSKDGTVTPIITAQDGAAAYVSTSSNDVRPINLATRTVGPPIPVGRSPAEVTVSPDGSTVYVADNLDGAVTPIDVPAASAEPEIRVGIHPFGIAIAPDQAPVAALAVNAAGAGQPTSFNASASRAPSSPIATYAWSFGDGASATTAVPTTTHTYAQAGTYAVTLTHTDGAGTSTTHVFTGRTMSRNGGPGATTTRQVIVPATISPALFATNGAANSVTGYAQTASGNVAPLTTLSGPATGLNGPRGILVTTSGDLFVSNATGNTITEYPPAATGNVAPIATISGTAPGLSSPRGIAIDGSGHLFVASAASSAITEYAPGATGNATPLATIAGAATGISGPEASRSTLPDTCSSATRQRAPSVNSPPARPVIPRHWPRSRARTPALPPRAEC